MDFAAFGDYGDFRRKQPQPATGEFVRPAYQFRGRITAEILPVPDHALGTIPPFRARWTVMWNRRHDYIP